MARVGFTHVSGRRAGETAWLPRLPATIGSDPDADIRLEATAPRHAVVFERDGMVVLLDSGSAEGTFLAGQMVQETILRTGDVIELGPNGPRLRFEHEGQSALVPAHPTLLAVPVETPRPAPLPAPLPAVPPFPTP